MVASKTTVDFSKAIEVEQGPSGFAPDPVRRVTHEGKVLSKAQIRARARRAVKRNEILNPTEKAFLYNHKPIEEWDMEELARGRPRNSKGHFSGPAPAWVDRKIVEESRTRYVNGIKTAMAATTVDALDVLKRLVLDERTDDKGKDIVPASVKLSAAQFLLEHVVGKPTQRIENDVSVKLQAILGQVMVNPAELATGPGVESFAPAHFPGLTMELYDAEDEQPRGE